MTVYWGFDPFRTMFDIFDARYPGHDIQIHMVPDLGNGTEGMPAVTHLYAGGAIDLFLDANLPAHDMFEAFVTELALIAVNFGGQVDFEDEEVPELEVTPAHERAFKLLSSDYLQYLRENHPEHIHDPYAPANDNQVETPELRRARMRMLVRDDPDKK